MKTTLLLLGSFILTAYACAGETKETGMTIPTKDEVEDTCDMASFSPYIGQHIDEVPTEVREPEGRRVRELYPLTPATMDYRPDRLNILLNDEGIIKSVRCG